MQQLDIFDDGRDRMLLNDVADAVARDDADAARVVAAALRTEFPDEPSLPAAERLIAVLAAAGEDAALDADAARSARQALEATIAPAAQTLLGREAASGWLARRWCALARRAARTPYHPKRADVHAAALYLAGGAWHEAEAAAQAIESWRRIPQPLAWVALARWQRHGLDACWPLLAELCWMAPALGRKLVQERAEPRLARLISRFEADLEPDDADWTWLPAWLLVEQPLLAPMLGTAECPDVAPAEQAFKLVVGLLGLERQGRHHELIERRRRLQRLAPRLFAAYMRTR